MDKVSRSCIHAPGRIAGQQATGKAEMNGFTPGLARRPDEWVEKAAKPSKCLAALFLISGRFFQI